MKRYFVSLLAVVLVALIGLTGCSSSGSTSVITGNYQQDTLAVVKILKNTIAPAEGTTEKVLSQTEARQLINEFVARYRRDGAVSTLPSFTTMQTALNSLAGHYGSYPNRPVPAKLQARLQKEFKRVEVSLNRGA